MKKLLLLFLLVVSAGANAQFSPGQILTAAELNSQFALYAKLTGAIFSGPITATSATLSGPLSAANISSTPISGASGSFTTLTASGAVGGGGFSALLSPYLTTAAASTTYAPINNATFTGTTTIPSAAISGGTLTTTTITNSNANNVSLGNVTPNTGAFTTLAASSTVSGAGFTTLLSPYALLASPTFTGTPAAPTATNGNSSSQLATTSFVNNELSSGLQAASFTTVAASGAITPSQTAGIVGTTTTNNANAGSVGEYATATTGATGATSSTVLNATSISLAAGDWDVQCDALFTAAGTTTTQLVAVGVGTNATPTIGAFGTYQEISGTTSAGFAQAVSSPTVRESLPSTTTVYCPAIAIFTVSTMTVTGLIRARRVR